MGKAHMPDLDQELFDQASALPATTEPTEGTEPEPAAPAASPDRDEHGRFKPKGESPEAPAAAAAPAVAATPAEPQPDHRIPLTELLNEREKRQAAERELAEFRRQQEQARPKPQPTPRPDIWQNPDGYTDAAINERITPLREQQDAIIDRFSRLMAVQQFTKPVVDEAYAALVAHVQANPGVNSYEAQRIWQNEHPYGALVDWHKSQKALKEIGNDPAAYRKRLADELMKDPEHRRALLAAIQAEAAAPVAGTRPASVTVLPPSLNRVASAAPSNPGSGDEAVDDRELFNLASRKRR